MSNINEIWPKTLELIRKEMTGVSFNTWIKKIEPMDFTGNNVVLAAPNDFTKKMLEDRYKILIESALEEITGEVLNVQFTLQGEVVKDIPKNESNQVNSFNIEQKSILNPKYTFDSFVTGNSNRLAHAAAVAVAEAPSQTYNPLFIYGGAGLGKTHLMHAISHFVLEQNPSSKVVYVSSEKFTNELITAIQVGGNEEFRAKYRDVDVLLIDDIQFLASKERTQEEFFHTFNALHEANKQIVISSDRPPKEIPTLEDRLSSRFEWGLITDIQPPDLETRIAILKKKASSENIIIDNDVFLYIASKVKSNIRELEGALIKIVAYSSLINTEITLDLAKEALKDIISNNVPIEITPDLIKEVIGKEYNLKQEDFVSRRRTRAIAYPRQIAMYLTRELTDLSLPKIGDEFGGRDHTTVIHAYDKISEEIKEDINFKNRIDRIIDDIKG